MSFPINKIVIYTSLALIAGCGSSGGGGSNSNNSQLPPPSPPAVTESSLDSVPAEYRDDVQKAKTFDPFAIGREDLDAEGLTMKNVTLNGKTLSNTDYSFSELKNGLQELSFTFDLEDSQSSRAEGSIFLYQQPYSIVTGSQISKGSGVVEPSIFYVDSIKGLQTTSVALDSLEGQLTYQGIAFNGKDEGSLNYVVDLDTRQGSGAISGISQTGRIDLLAANIANLNTEWLQGMGIAGKATFEKDSSADIGYELGFFGPNAEEIAGRVSYLQDQDNGINEIGFGGKR